MLRTRCDDAYLFFLYRNNSKNNNLSSTGEMAERLTKSSGTILNINCILVDGPEGKIQEVFCNACSDRGAPSVDINRNSS